MQKPFLFFQPKSAAFASVARVILYLSRMKNRYIWTRGVLDVDA